MISSFGIERGVHAMEKDEMIIKIIVLLKENKRKDFHRFIEELQPYDLADLYKELPEKHRKKYVNFLGKESTVLLIQELESIFQLEVIEKINAKTLTYVLDKMDNDDLAALLDTIPIEQKEELLNKMDDDESELVQNILAYEPETAGRLMTNRFVWIPKHYTVRQAVDKMKEYAQFSETINYLYVVDDEKRLSGVVSYRDLILSGENEKIEEIMFSRAIHVFVNDDQEKIANIIEKYDFLALPVVEEDGKLVGIVTFDDILDIVIKEANEDIQKLSAGGKDIDFKTKATTAAIRRLPWLILLLLIGLVSGNIISQFENTLHTVVALTYFMPMIAGMTGNTGTQSLAVTVRGLGNQEIDSKVLGRLILRETIVGLLIGLVCGIIITLVAFLWQGNLMLGLVVGTSLFLTLIIGTLAGTIIPIILYKLKIDPAIASGPLITTLNDIFSLLVYFKLATIFIQNIV